VRKTSARMFPRTWICLVMNIKGTRGLTQLGGPDANDNVNGKGRVIPAGWSRRQAVSASRDRVNVRFPLIPAMVRIYWVTRRLKMLAKTKGSNVIRGPAGKSDSIRSDRAPGYWRL
jgi:hypothetical protein